MPVLSSHSCPETQQFLMTSLRVSNVFLERGNQLSKVPLCICILSLPSSLRQLLLSHQLS